MKETKRLAKRKNSGGARKGAGAKPKPFLEKTDQVNIRLKNSLIKELGGKEAVRSLLINFVTSQSHINNSLNRLTGN